jgi:methylmalonyl-CoA/ethylmalonyl-CoA epimerase
VKAALHHIGILVKDIERACRSYQQRFGYTVHSDVIHDPLQTAYVQFLRGDGAGPLVELVSPDGPESKLSNALKKGEGLNHLCYFAEAIEDDCRELRSQGMLILQSPVVAEAFSGRRIAWLMGADGLPIELVEPGPGI